jgi:pimeloyl-ACP methyl ester carboxylesterase
MEAIVTDTQTSMVVLVHGGRHDGWCWHLVQAELDRLGIGSVAPDLPDTSLDAEIATVRDIVADLRDRDLVVVGHSRGGRVISAAASEAPNVRGLVYVTAMLLEENEPYTPGRRYNPANRVDAAIDPDALRDRMYHDVPQPLFDEALTHLHPVTAAALVVTPLTVPAAWRSIYTTYVVCTEDRYVDPPVQWAMARHADRVVELGASHVPFFSRPAELAAIIAEQVRTRPTRA